MSRTSDGNPAQRMKIGGGWAEGQFVAYAKKNKISIERYGFDNATIKNFRKLPAFVRHTPDYVATKDRVGFAVECKGAGRGKVVNFKLEDTEAWKEWNSYIPFYLFIFDSDKKKVSLQCADKILDDIFWGEVPVGVWHDGVQHYQVPKTMFEWEDADDGGS